MSVKLKIYHRIQDISPAIIPFRTDKFQRPNGLSDLIKLKIQFKVNQRYLKRKKKVRINFYLELLDQSYFLLDESDDNNIKIFPCSIEVSAKESNSYMEEEFEFRIRNVTGFSPPSTGQGSSTERTGIPLNQRIRLRTYATRIGRNDETIVSQLTKHINYEVIQISA